MAGRQKGQIPFFLLCRLPLEDNCGGFIMQNCALDPSRLVHLSTTTMGWAGKLKTKDCFPAWFLQLTNLQCEGKGARRKVTYDTRPHPFPANDVCVLSTLICLENPPTSHWEWWKMGIVAMANTQRVWKPDRVPSYKLFRWGKIRILFRSFRGIVTTGLRLSPVLLSRALQAPVCLSICCALL